MAWGVFKARETPMGTLTTMPRLQQAGARGNRNSLKNGNTAFLSGRWPGGCQAITRAVRKLRKQLEGEIIARTGDLDVYSAALIQTATRHEARALLWQRWARERFDTLTTEQLLAITRELGSASDARDRCLKALGLDVRPGADPWGDLYASLGAAGSGTNGKLVKSQVNGTPHSPATARGGSGPTDGVGAAATGTAGAGRPIPASEGEAADGGGGDRGGESTNGAAGHR